MVLAGSKFENRPFEELWFLPSSGFAYSKIMGIRRYIYISYSTVCLAPSRFVKHAMLYGTHAYITLASHLIQTSSNIQRYCPSLPNTDCAQRVGSPPGPRVRPLNARTYLQRTIKNHNVPEIWGLESGGLKQGSNKGTCFQKSILRWRDFSHDSGSVVCLFGIPASPRPGRLLGIVLCFCVSSKGVQANSWLRLSHCTCMC